MHYCERQFACMCHSCNSQYFLIQISSLMVEGMCKVYKHEDLSMAFWKRDQARSMCSIFIQVFSLWCRLVQLLVDLNGLVEMRLRQNLGPSRDIPVLFGDGRRFGVGRGSLRGDSVELEYSDLIDLAEDSGRVRPELPGLEALHFFVYNCEVRHHFDGSLVLMTCSICVGISIMRCLPSQGFSSSRQLLACSFIPESSLQAIRKLNSISALRCSLLMKSLIVS